MKRFILKASLLLLPFALYALCIVVIDPFERFGVGRFMPVHDKSKVAIAFNSLLWKVIEFNRAPHPNITLGASKMNLLTPDLLKEASAVDYHNLSVGGGSALEFIHLFWFAASRAKLERVVFGIGIENFNEYINRDSVKGAEATASNPLLYVINRDVASAAKHLVLMKYFGAAPPSTAPPMRKDEFWEVQLDEATTRIFAKYRFNEGAYGELAEISAYCRERGIELTFAILPSHADVHERLRQLGVEEEWKSLPLRLGQLGKTHDFDVDDELTASRDNFTDPFHFGPDAARRLAGAIGSDGGARAR
ncbi:hypothetical protein WME75_37655 [Sorangium sp. So ce1014]|uniref:hypothetical protein n=1 Tax=Sorangium sp. So ce1014 TaxID=3133326 RepID=UPI003F622384